MLTLKQIWNKIFGWSLETKHEKMFYNVVEEWLQQKLKTFEYMPTFTELGYNLAINEIITELQSLSDKN